MPEVQGPAEDGARKAQPPSARHPDSSSDPLPEAASVSDSTVPQVPLRTQFHLPQAALAIDSFCIQSSSVLSTTWDRNLGVIFGSCFRLIVSNPPANPAKSILKETTPCSLNVVVKAALTPRLLYSGMNPLPAHCYPFTKGFSPR